MGPKGPWIADGVFGQAHLWNALFRTILLLIRITQFTDVYRGRYLIFCYNFLSFLLCFNKRSRLGTEAAKSLLAFSASLEGGIYIFGDRSSEAKLWIGSKSVSVSTTSTVSIVLKGSRMLKITGRWSEFRMSVIMASESWTFCIQVTYHDGLTSTTYELWCLSSQSLRRFIDSYK
jgi:hypothetical protein